MRPAFATGFRQFLAAPRIEKVVAEEIAREIAEGKSDPFDSHPPLRERLTELAKLSQGETPGADVPATSLLRKLDALEAELLALATGNPEISTWRSVLWERVGEEVYLPNWRRTATEHASSLQGFRPIDFPRMAADPVAFGRRFASKSELPSKEVLTQRAIEIAGSAFALALHDHGWNLRADPGEPFAFFQAGTRLEPFSILRMLVSGELAREAWEQLCREAAMAEWDLGGSPSRPPGAAGPALKH